jgi:DNA-directed RNA polymerase specialized sigma24 family protein
LLALRYEENLPCDQIAHRLAGSLDAIYQSLSRVRGRLEECIRRRLSLQERAL